MKAMYVYILTNINNTTLYIGVTNDLKRRIFEHKSGLFKSAFTARYSLTKLVYFECHEDELIAIAREKYLKKAFRKEKIKLIEAKNPLWNDLYDEVCL